MQTNSSVRPGTVAILAMMAAACGLPGRAAEPPDAAIERGKQFIAAGEYTKAERELRWAMDHLEAPPGQSYIQAAGNLGVALYYRGQFARAEAAYSRALSVRDRLPAGSQLEVATVLNNLGVLYNRTGRAELAERAALEALRIREKIEGRDNVSLAGPLITIAASCHDRGKYDEAETYARRAVSVLSQPGVPPAVNLTVALRQLAVTRLKQGEVDEADRLLSCAKEIQQGLPGSDDGPQMALLYSATGALRSAQHRYEEAAALLRQAIAIWRRSARARSSEVAAALNNLAQVRKLTGYYAQAEPLYREAIAMCADTLGREHATCALFTGNLAGLLATQGRGRDAARLYEEAIAALEKEVAPDHPELVQLRSQLSGLAAARQAGWTVGFRELQRPTQP